MAEGSEYHQVHLRTAKKPVCDLCEIELDSQLWKCLDCNIYICEPCVTCSHERIPELKNHTIISRIESEEIKISNISKLCSSHPDNEVIYHCSTCNDLICAECVIEIHEKHEFTKIETIAKQKRKNRITHINTANNEVIPKMTKQIDDLKEKIKINDKHKEDILQKIQHQIKNMISELENVGKETEAECINHHQKNEDKMEMKQINLTKDVSEIQTMSCDFNAIYNTGSDIEVIRAEQEIAEKLTLLKASNPPDMNTEEDLPIFIEGKTDNKILKTMFGSLQSGPKCSKVGVEVVNQFKHKSEVVQCICPLADNTAVIHYQRLYDNDIVTVDGQVQQTMKLDIDVLDFTLTSQGDIMCASGSDLTIFKLTNGVVTDTISTAPLLAVCLCESRDGNLLVGLVEERSVNIKESSRRCVSKITMKGEILRSYEYNKGSRLFTVPRSVSENINGDVCVVNTTSYTTGHLVILDSGGQLKSTYNGQQLKEEFYPFYVKCDTLGNILVNDPYNLKVHMLNSQCQFVRYVLTENKLRNYPYSLAVDNKTGVLWVGGDKGHIYTTKYLE